MPWDAALLSSCSRLNSSKSSSYEEQEGCLFCIVGLGMNLVFSYQTHTAQTLLNLDVLAGTKYMELEHLGTAHLRNHLNWRFI